MMLLLAGCAQGDPTPIRGQTQAVAIIWNIFYGETKAPPVIYWRRDHCNEPNGIYARDPACTFDIDGDRYSGIQRDGYVEVGAPWETGKISDTALRHELLHASIGDDDHQSPKWETLIPAARSALINAGL